MRTADWQSWFVPCIQNIFVSITHTDIYIYIYKYVYIHNIKFLGFMILTPRLGQTQQMVRRPRHLPSPVAGHLGDMVQVPGHENRAAVAAAAERIQKIQEASHLEQSGYASNDHPSKWMVYLSGF